jgi:hypothetical protein
MKAYKLYCANNTETHPIKLGYGGFQFKNLPLNAQIVDRRAVCHIPDTSRDPLVSVGWVALNIGTITSPEWKMCSMPLKAHENDLYVEVHHVDNLCVTKLEEKLKRVVKLHDEVARFNHL